MRAFRLNGFDTAPEIEELPRPVPQEGEALVRIAACGLNFADLLMLTGRYQDTPAPPFTMGMEVAGIVEEEAASSRACCYRNIQTGPHE